MTQLSIIIVLDSCRSQCWTGTQPQTCKAYSPFNSARYHRYISNMLQAHITSRLNSLICAVHLKKASVFLFFSSLWKARVHGSVSACLWLTAFQSLEEAVLSAGQGDKLLRKRKPAKLLKNALFVLHSSWQHNTICQPFVAARNIIQCTGKILCLSRLQMCQLTHRKTWLYAPKAHNTIHHSRTRLTYNLTNMQSD